jgi:L-amino acid N-acyltransferase YncA
VARIKKDNLTSISFFERFGFRLERETVVNGFSALQYAYDVSPLESKAS